MAKAPAKKKAAKRPVRKASKAAPPARNIKVTAPAGKAITQGALMQVVADHAEMSRAEAKRFVETYIDVVRAHVLKGVKVKLGDLGTVMIRARKARMGRNPQTGEAIKIKAKTVVRLRAAKAFKDAILG